MYITDSELRGLVSNERLDNLSEELAAIYIDAAAELIDRYCRRPFTNAIPAVVKIVAAELVNVMLQDSTRQSESKGDYSYSVNDKAFSQILGKLDAIMDEASISSRKAVTAYVL